MESRSNLNQNLHTLVIKQENKTEILISKDQKIRNFQYYQKLVEKKDNCIKNLNHKIDSLKDQFKSLKEKYQSAIQNEEFFKKKFQQQLKKNLSYEQQIYTIINHIKTSILTITKFQLNNENQCIQNYRKIQEEIQGYIQPLKDKNQNLRFNENGYFSIKILGILDKTINLLLKDSSTLCQLKNKLDQLSWEKSFHQLQMKGLKKQIQNLKNKFMKDGSMKNHQTKQQKIIYMYHSDGALYQTNNQKQIEDQVDIKIRQNLKQREQHNLQEKFILKKQLTNPLQKI